MKKPFVHPGLLHSREELAFIKQKVTAGEEPWKTAWEKLQESPSASLNHTPRPRPEVVRGPYNNPNIGSSELSGDSSAAYTHALQWCLTGKQAHAQKAIALLNAWSSTLKTVSGHDTKLLIGMVGVHLCNAAELLRHTDAGWLKDDQKQFEHLLRQVFYPAIKDFFPKANGNWDASMIQTMLAMGVFLDDQAMFERAVTYFQKGEGNGAIEHYFNAFGECQESGRDQAHTQMGLGFLGCACEMAWKQGVDLYSTSNSRLALGFEYTAKYNLGHDVPYETYTSIGGTYVNPTISPKSRGRFAPIYERIVHHYHVRKKLEMPHCREVVAKTRPEISQSGGHIPWGTLMFAELRLAKS
ncbi:alginate lyase family protein [Armatimonas sp.]|uniref:alginate lyase family protein n=1 Tax=Armatimonas sp. TaxID=1872638 RepID=UPI00286AE2C4|nr:alginate lyase family protein [Armatimonas sp.]